MKRIPVNGFEAVTPRPKVGTNAGNRGKGRKKGVPNKATASIKAAFLEAFQQRGGVPALMAWADTEPTEFYKLAAKLIPTEVSGLDGASLLAGVVILPPVKS